MKNFQNILISSAGRRVELVQIWKKVAKNVLGNNVMVYTCDKKPELSPACRISDRSFKVCDVNDVNYKKQILQKCLEYKIGLIIPTIDNELLLYSRIRDLFKEKGIFILISDENLVLKCRNKKLTKELFESLEINYPTLYEKSNLKFPLIIKPIDGSSSLGIKIIEHKNQLSINDLDNENNIYQTYLSSDWDEFSVDLIYNSKGVLCCCVPRQRISTRAGEISKGRTKKNNLYLLLLKKLSYIKGARGVLTLQLFFNKNDNNFYGIEINARFGGGYPMSFYSGANYPEMIIKEYLLNIEPVFSEAWKDEMIFLRYDSTMVIDN